MAKKIFLTMMMFTVMAIFANCASKKIKDEPKSYQPPKYTVGEYYRLKDSTGRRGDQAVPPEWVSDEGGIISFRGEKYAWIKGSGESLSDLKAKTNAKNDARGSLAAEVKVLITRQYAQAWESLGHREKESIEQISRGLTATRTSLSVGGFGAITAYGEFLQKITALDGNGNPSQFGKGFWRYHVMMGLPYNDFVRLRNQLARDYIKEKRPNARQKKLLMRAEKELRKLDHSPKELHIKASSNNQGGTSQL